MDQADLCRLRIEQYSKERESLRTMEWRIVFELFAGYAALAIAFNKLHNQSPHSWPVTSGGVAAVVLLFSCGWTILDGVHKRMMHAARLTKRYFHRLHHLLNLEPETEPTAEELRWWWATYPQLVMLAAINAGLIAWMLWSNITGKV